LKLLEALEGPKTRGPIALMRTLPAPLGGWNSRDKYGPTTSPTVLKYAPEIVNFMIVNGRLENRPGYVPWVTGLPASPVRTLMEYTGVDGVPKLFAAVDTKIFNVTITGTAGAAVYSALSVGGDQLQHIMFATTSGNYLVSVNGLDGVLTYSGSAWAVQTLTGGVVAGSLTDVSAHQGRLWFTQGGSLVAWYLAPFAIAGVATKFNLGPLCKRGGSLVGVATWTHDSGAGSDDLLVFVTTEGEVLVYSGVDPNSASTFGLVGIYLTSQPVSRRCFRKFGADLALLTTTGVVLMSAVLASGVADTSVVGSISDPIRDDFSMAARDAAGSSDWDILHYQSRGFLMVNVPKLVTGTYDQFVYNPIYEAWFRFTNIPSTCWSSTANGIYLGGSGAVWRWDYGAIADVPSLSAAVVPIDCRVKFAWWNYGMEAVKTFSLCQPHFFTDGVLGPTISMRTGYHEDEPVGTVIPSEETAGTAWDEGDWDTFEWAGGEARPFSPWLTLEGEGIIGSLAISLSTKTANVSLSAVNVAFVSGGIGI
jgi:hypothetical protein